MKILFEMKEQEAKGRLAGAILLRALQPHTSLKQAIRLIAPADGEAAWHDMHSVAHMWAARSEFPEIFPDLADLERGVFPPEPLTLVPFLRRCEELLDAMQARPDLAHNDPWRCSPETRRQIGLPS